MKRYVLAGLVVTTVSAAAQAPRPPAPGTPCANLAALTIPDVTINAATPIAAGAFTPPGPPLPGALAPLPAFCRVEATARPTSDSEISEMPVPVEANATRPPAAEKPNR